MRRQAAGEQLYHALSYPERYGVRGWRLGHYAMFLGKSNGRLGGYVRNRNRGERQWLHPRHWEAGGTKAGRHEGDAGRISWSIKKSLTVS